MLHVCIWVTSCNGRRLNGLWGSAVAAAAAAVCHTGKSHCMGRYEVVRILLMRMQMRMLIVRHESVRGIVLSKHYRVSRTHTCAHTHAAHAHNCAGGGSAIDLNVFQAVLETRERLTQAVLFDVQRKRRDAATRHRACAQRCDCMTQVAET